MTYTYTVASWAPCGRDLPAIQLSVLLKDLTKDGGRVVAITPCPTHTTRVLIVIETAHS